MKLWLSLALCLVVLLVLAGCGPAPTPTVMPTPTPVVVEDGADLVGTWKGSSGVDYFRFTGEGVFTVADSAAALDTMSIHGTYRMEGGVFYVADSVCTEEGSYRVEVLASEGGKPSRLQFRAVKDACVQGRRDSFLKSKYERITP